MKRVKMESRLVKFFESIEKATYTNKISWEDTSVIGLFQTNFSNTSLQIGFKEEYDEESESNNNRYYVKIVDYRGELIDSITDSMLYSEYKEDRSIFKRIENLYNEARRSAKGASGAIDAIISEINL